MIRVITRPLLVQGMLATDEVGNRVILIAEDQSEEEQQASYWHEIVHLVLLEYGIEKHDEDKVEAIAQLLTQQKWERLDGTNR